MPQPCSLRQRFPKGSNVYASAGCATSFAIRKKEECLIGERLLSNNNNYTRVPRVAKTSWWDWKTFRSRETSWLLSSLAQVQVTGCTPLSQAVAKQVKSHSDLGNPLACQLLSTTLKAPFHGKQTWKNNKQATMCPVAWPTQR